MPKRNVFSAGMVICLERGADLYMAQLMPLPTHSRQPRHHPIARHRRNKEKMPTVKKHLLLLMFVLFLYHFLYIVVFPVTKRQLINVVIVAITRDVKTVYFSEP